ncbi:hypothetical protein FSC37_19150 [Piscinibacter aquaticus]|uniref:Uncharacterized protein n=1 Tax=Piscinibacter aquaticus TaxID=392597 RepID=A0A5C6U5F0_9BURK|nr:hypothetical protein FSC37_19150 [Piscinibacter aquaticus]
MKPNKILAALAVALLIPASQGAELAWAATSVITKMDPATGQFARRGLAMFPGEIVPFTIEGQILTSEGPAQTFRTKIVYTFEDGSTLVQEGRAAPSGSHPAATCRAAAGVSPPALAAGPG